MILSELREQTQEHHEAIEAIVDLMNPSLTRERYLRLLQDFHGFYGPIESMLSARSDWGSVGILWEEREKLPRLRQDLLALDMTVGEIDSLPSCPKDAAPPLESLEAALGCMYVLEGATLGGRIISKRLKASFGMDERSGAAFFLGYGPERVGPMWKGFGVAVTEFARNSRHRAEIVESARLTFDSFGRWLTRKAGAAQ